MDRLRSLGPWRSDLGRPRDRLYPVLAVSFALVRVTVLPIGMAARYAMHTGVCFGSGRTVEVAAGRDPGPIHSSELLNGGSRLSPGRRNGAGSLAARLCRR